jgi:hypothetical protein
MEEGSRVLYDALDRHENSKGGTILLKALEGQVMDKNSNQLITVTT